MFDVTIIVANAEIDDENQPYAVTSVIRCDLEDEPGEDIAIDAFMDYVRNYPGVVHMERLRA